LIILLVDAMTQNFYLTVCVNSVISFIEPNGSFTSIREVAAAAFFLWH